MQELIKNYSEIPFTHSVVNDLLSEYRRPNDKISDLIQRGELISLRRGLYIPGPETNLPIPDLFLIANHLRGPSYVTMEAAFSYWGMIPERVFEVSSATIKTSTTYRTPIGRFTFSYLPSPYYSFGVRSVQLTELQTALIASPEKALCDKIILTSGINLRSMSQTESFLFEDLRLDEEVVANFDLHAVESWIENAPKKSSLEMLIKTLERIYNG